MTATKKSSKSAARTPAAKNTKKTATTPADGSVQADGSGKGPETLLAGAVEVLPAKGKRAAHPSTNQRDSDLNPQPASGKATKTKKAAAPKKEPRKRGEPKEDLVVFAFRLTQAEREAIHKAAGAAKASRFVRTLAVAAAHRDEAKVRELVKFAGTTS